ncbi:BsuPI-related putative proteinase inhibitor [Halosolutus gelatinilyticus]|uniref:BsuPI-related putative proteinase inhibitor n=1 Tax=Halosolutus gelatinilyticus TaxID=2931975 RepID=UPI001FF2B4F5|nr:BsuPI-related putative proteinase inhibitor [Halosolutus gelatinilyticus]
MELEGSLEATVSTDESESETVTFALTVTNAGDDPLELQFSDACRAEFVVESEGREVWRFTDGRMFAQVLGSETIDPGARATYEGEWSDPESGEYTALGALQSRNATYEARTEFTV